ncbi:MAG: hypothetical protein MJK04_32515, partial [Psychrosphaera sp.]|nr:hypothetical protein [Psychrosphaera sp.]
LQFLSVCATITARKAKGDVSDHALRYTCLLTRQFNEGKFTDVFVELSALFCQFEPDQDSETSPMLQRFCALNEYLEANKTQPDYGSKLHDLHTVIAICVGDRDLSQKRERKTGERGFVIREVIGGDEDDQLTVITDTSVDEETEYQSQIVDGGAPNEVKSPRVQIKAALPQNMPKGWTDSRQIAYRQKGMLNAIAQRNQGLVFQMSRLRRGELKTILDNCDKELFCLEDSLSNGFVEGVGEKLETQLAILLLLLTGLPLAELPGITMVKKNESNQLHIKPLEKGKKIALSFEPSKHKLVRIKPARFEQTVHKPSNYLELQVGDAFYPLLKRVFHIKKWQGLQLHEPLLSTSLPTLEENVKQQLKVWNKFTSGHMSIARLTAWLSHAIHELTGDLAACFYSSNNAGNKPAQAYYANYDHKQLLETYWQLTSKTFVLDGSVQKSDLKIDPATTGSRLASIHSTLPFLVGNLVESVGDPVPGGFGENIELHNRLVTYIYMMFAFGIGIRSVNDPLESINNVDLASGVILLNDKENRSVANSRFVFMPTILQQQIVAYKKHLSALQVAANASNFALRQQIAASISGENNTPMLFFINCDNKRYERVTPKKLTGRLKGFWPVPLNMGRHYLRSELVRRGCPAYWIDAMMGHAEIGVEPNSKFSAITFGTLKRLTVQHLDPLVEQGQWQVLKGLSC